MSKPSKTEKRIDSALNALAHAESACEIGDCGDALEWVNAAQESLLDTAEGARTTGVRPPRKSKAKKRAKARRKK